MLETQARRGYQLGLVYSPKRQDDRFASRVSALERDGHLAIARVDMERAIRPFADTRSFLQLRRIVRERRPDVLHLHCSKAGMLGRLTRPLLGRRAPAVVYQPHGFSFLRCSGPKALLLRAMEVSTSSLVDLCVATSESERSLALTGLPAWHGPMAVLPNVVEATPAPIAEVRRVRRDLGISDDAFVLCCVGNLVVEKRVEDIISAAALVQSTGRQIHVLVVGEGATRSELEERAGHHGIRGRVHFVGYVPRPGVYQQAADVVVHAAAFESFGLAIAEAMLLAKPVVAADAPGACELVRHGQSGLLYSVGDVHALANALIRLADDHTLRRSLGESARAALSGRFTSEGISAALHALYRRALGQAHDQPL